MRTSLYDYCSERNELALLTQWHPVRNEPLTPRQVSYGSKQKTWWQCPDGHIWKAVIYSRAGPQKTGCPVCAGKVRPKRLERYRRTLAEMK